MKKYDVKNFTLREKCAMLTGVGAWETSSANGKARALWLSDGPCGLRMHNPENHAETFTATAMPACHVLANSWNKELAYEYGVTIAEDCIERGADVLLAPAVNIKRTPLCGRNFEYLSEDPYLAGVMAAEYIKGVQGKGIGTSLKHYCANNREDDRGHESSDVDERTLREIYLKPFEIAVQAKPWTVMCSYNPVNGIYASENKKLLNDVLRGQFAFDGLIMSDWGAVHNPVLAVEATLDLCMPEYGHYADALTKAVESGRLSEEKIDERVEKVLELVEKREAAADKRKITMTKEQRHEKAVEAAKEGIVLLKNENSALPICGKNGEGKQTRALIVGGYAANPCIVGGGSANTKTAFRQTPLHILLQEKTGAETRFYGKYADCGWRRLYDEAYLADVTLIATGHGDTVESECFDRDTLKLTASQEEEILRLAARSKKTVVIVYAGSAIDMSAWIDAVDAVVFAGYAGEGVNEALASLLCGEANFSGKLAETFPLCLEDTFKGGKTTSGEADVYDDGIYVGYRYYDHMQKEVLFPFGHGLSYSSFEYSNLRIERTGEEEWEVAYDITNRSAVAGKEISEVYVKDVTAMVHRPEKELKAFSKDLILPNETKTVRVKLDLSAFSYYNTSLERWHAENGWFEIYVGSSSRSLKLKGQIELKLPEDTQYSIG